MISNLTATPATNGIGLSWSGNGPFRVYAPSHQLLAEPSSGEYFDGTLTEGHEQTYTVCEVVDGEDGDSAQVTATTTLVTPGNPGGTPSASVTLTAQNNSGLSAPRYSWRHRVNSGSWEEFGPFDFSGSLTKEFTGLGSGSHEFQVRIEQVQPASASEWSSSFALTLG
jgi:hypothetical protein